MLLAYFLLSFSFLTFSLFFTFSYYCSRNSFSISLYFILYNLLIFLLGNPYFLLLCLTAFFLSLPYLLIHILLHAGLLQCYGSQMIKLRIKFKLNVDSYLLFVLRLHTFVHSGRHAAPYIQHTKI
jgi:hypothetical protein